MNILFIGHNQFSYSLLAHVQTLHFKLGVNIVGVVTKKNSSFHSDSCSLESWAKKHEIPYFLFSKGEENPMALWIKKLKPHVMYCFGWPHLLKRDILDIPPLGVVGYHPTFLPMYRGRHPLIWTLALGLKKTASTFFFMDEGADSGDILAQKQVVIQEREDAFSLYKKLTTIALEQTTHFTKALTKGDIVRIPQDHSQATYWRKRTFKDGLIDWRMSACVIDRLIRALTRPYGGASCGYKGSDIKIWKAQIEEEAQPSEMIGAEPGKIIAVEEDHIVVKCGQGVLKILEHEFMLLPQRDEYL